MVEYLCGIPNNRQIELLVPDTTLITGLNLRSDIVFTDNGDTWIRLFADSGDYDTIGTGEGTDLKPTANGFFFSIGLVQRGFNMKVTYTETNVRIAVAKIARYHAINNSLATVTDYLSPEIDDYLTGFTVRQGIIKAPINNKGTTMSDASYSTEGFTFTFMEAKNYYV